LDLFQLIGLGLSDIRKLNNSIIITGATGFVAHNLSPYLKDNFFLDIKSVDLRNKDAIGSITNSNIIIHLAGKAHDLQNVINPDEYYRVNTDLTKIIFDEFLASDAKVFITLSSVKAVADQVEDILFENIMPNPLTHYGKSKLLAEQYILSKEIPKGKRVYILRPSMIHGPGNKGNLNLLHNLISKGLPWPLGAFNNKRSYCSIDNLLFIIKELIERDDISSGIYNVADDEALSTNELIGLIAHSQNRKPKIWNISKKFILCFARIGDKIHLPLNTERLQKLTSSYIVSNGKIKAAIAKPLPVSSRDGLIKTFRFFCGNRKFQSLNLVTDQISKIY
jgi:nucleoside-diphosphate-sugar epimerase